MEIKVKVTRNYQVTIPSEVRELLGIKVGSYIKFIIDPDTKRVYIERAITERKRLRLGKRLDPEEIDRIIERGMIECMK